MDWRHRASCLDEDPELFFPIGNTGPALLQIDQAKAVCGRCAVVDTCLAWAIETGQDAGVWGGLSEDERYELLAARRRAAANRRSSRFWYSASVQPCALQPYRSVTSSARSPGTLAAKMPSWAARSVPVRSRSR